MMDTRYTDKLTPIKAKYPEFAQKMSPRFYDSARFFSEEMLFGRCDTITGGSACERFRMPPDRSAAPYRFWSSCCCGRTDSD